jgi:hypothetical protein
MRVRDGDVTEWSASLYTHPPRGAKDGYTVIARLSL